MAAVAIPAVCFCVSMCLCISETIEWIKIGYRDAVSSVGQRDEGPSVRLDRDLSAEA